MQALLESLRRLKYMSGPFKPSLLLWMCVWNGCTLIGYDSTAAVIDASLGTVDTASGQSEVDSAVLDAGGPSNDGGPGNDGGPPALR